MKEDYILKRGDNAERRFTSPDIQVRADGDSNIIEGIAAVVDSVTDIGPFMEKIAPGAFDDVMRDDVVALFNHDPNFPLARTTASEGKLDLFLNKRGDLGYRFAAPNTSVGRDMIENIRTGVIAKSSFAFTIDKDKWEVVMDNDCGYWGCLDESLSDDERDKAVDIMKEKYGEPDGYKDIIEVLIGAGVNADWC